jgi:hypothetical protein
MWRNLTCCNLKETVLKFVDIATIFNYKNTQYGYFKTMKPYEVNAFTSGHFCFIPIGKLIFAATLMKVSIAVQSKSEQTGIG